MPSSLPDTERHVLPNYPRIRRVVIVSESKNGPFLALPIATYGYSGCSIETDGRSSDCTSIRRQRSHERPAHSLLQATRVTSDGSWFYSGHSDTSELQKLPSANLARYRDKDVSKKDRMPGPKREREFRDDTSTQDTALHGAEDQDLIAGCVFEVIGSCPECARRLLGGYGSATLPGRDSLDKTTLAEEATRTSAGQQPDSASKILWLVGQAGSGRLALGRTLRMTAAEGNQYADFRRTVGSEHPDQDHVYRDIEGDPWSECDLLSIRVQKLEKRCQSRCSGPDGGTEERSAESCPMPGPLAKFLLFGCSCLLDAIIGVYAYRRQSRHMWLESDRVWIDGSMADLVFFFSLLGSTMAMRAYAYLNKNDNFQPFVIAAAGIGWSCSEGIIGGDFMSDSLLILPWVVLAALVLSDVGHTLLRTRRIYRRTDVDGAAEKGYLLLP